MLHREVTRQVPSGTWRGTPSSLVMLSLCQKAGSVPEVLQHFLYNLVYNYVLLPHTPPIYIPKTVSQPYSLLLNR